MTMITVRSRAGYRYGNKIASDLWQFDSEQLTGDQWYAIQAYCRAYPETLVRREESPKPAPIVQPEPEPVVVDTRPDVIDRPTSSELYVDPIRTEFEKDLECQIHVSQAQERLNFWGSVHGLRDSAKNVELITEWLNANVRGYLSGPGIDAAVANLRKQLEWDTPKPIARPAVVPTNDEVLGTLPNGQSQLSITRRIPSTASAAQAKDWLSRFREANGLKFNAFGR